MEKREYSVIGKPVPQLGSVHKATGSAKYVDDIVLPGMLYGKILRSPYAHAKIRNIDTGRAQKLRGVRAIITAKDIPRVKITGGSLRGVDRHALAVEKVRYVGDEVAAVAATDEDTAEEALDLIEVEYEELPAVFETEEAMRSGAPIIHDDIKDNIAFKVTHIVGDVDKGFKESYHIREDRLETPMQQAAFLGSRGAVADFDPITHELTLYTEVTMPYTSLGLLARVLALPENKIRIIRPYIGGGFGQKSRATTDVCLCSAFLSMRTGKPVKVMHTREEEFMTAPGRQPLVAYFKTGVNKDGTLRAMQCRRLANTGAYVGGSPSFAKQDVGIFDLLFRCPNVRFESFSVYTNTIPSGSLRGLTNTALGFGLQSHMDMIARDLDLDIVRFYLKNVHQKGDITNSRYKLDSCGLSECVQIAAETSKWKEKRGKLKNSRGIGLAASGHTCGYRYGDIPDLSTALVMVNSEGTVRLLSGRAEAGMGPGTMQAMCVAEELGLRVEDIAINEFVDTKVIPFDCGNYGSRGTIQQGNAAVAAARDVRQQLFEAVALELKTTPDDLEAKNGAIFLRGSPTKGMSFKEAVKAYEAAGKVLPLIGRGSYDPPTEGWDEHGVGNNSIAYGFGVQVAEVEVDIETGQVKVLNLVSANDCGKVINPLILDGESQGGVSMSLGMALFEEISYDEQGRLRETSFSDYHLPTVWQQPPVETIWVETLDPHGPYGAKGITEIVSMPTAPAIANAVYDAVGVRINKLPITPRKILEGLRQKETDKSS